MMSNVDGHHSVLWLSGIRKEGDGPDKAAKDDKFLMSMTNKYFHCWLCWFMITIMIQSFITCLGKRWHWRSGCCDHLLFPLHLTCDHHVLCLGELSFQLCSSQAHAWRCHCWCRRWRSRCPRWTQWRWCSASLPSSVLEAEVCFQNWIFCEGRLCLSHFREWYEAGDNGWPL